MPKLRQFRYPDIPVDLLAPPTAADTSSEDNHGDHDQQNGTSENDPGQHDAGNDQRRPPPPRSGHDRLLVVGVLGKSNHPTTAGTKMTPLDVLQFYPEFEPLLASKSPASCCDITFYMQPPPALQHHDDGGSSARSKSYRRGRGRRSLASTTAILYMHFAGPDDASIIEHLPDAWLADPAHNALTLAAWARQLSPRQLLLAIHTCHLLVLAEPAGTFDTALLASLKALRAVRERFVQPQLEATLMPHAADCTLRLLPQLGREARLCSPRVLFHFGRASAPGRHAAEEVTRLEYEMEDRIYKWLRHDFVITNSAAASLFSIPRNKRFVYMKHDQQPQQQHGGVETDDPLLDALALLDEFIEASGRDRRSSAGTGIPDFASDVDALRPWRGYAKPLAAYADSAAAIDAESLDLLYDVGDADAAGVEAKPRSFRALLRGHIDEALDNGFDDSCSKFKGKSQFVVPRVANWFEWFAAMHRLFIVEEPPSNGDEEESGEVDTEPNAASGATNIARLARRFRRGLAAQLTAALDPDARFFADCEEHGVAVATDAYADQLPKFYGWDYHMQRFTRAQEVLGRFARRPGALERMRQRLFAECGALWRRDRRQCDRRSVRGNVCMKAAHGDGGGDEVDQSHNSTVVYISTCNCGRTQGRRCDPFTVREANAEFYAQMAQKCSGCQAAKFYAMPVFQPSGREFRAAAVAQTTKESSGGAAAGNKSMPRVSTDAADQSSQHSQNSLYLQFSPMDDDDAAVAAADAANGAGDGDNEDDGRVVHRSEGVCNADDANEAQQLLEALAIDAAAMSISDDKTHSDAAAGGDSKDDSDDDGDGLDCDEASDEDLNSDEHLLDCQEKDARLDASTANASPATTAADLLLRQPSTVEYLPGMLHTASPAGLLPQFASWSLCCIGPSSIYSHNSGLQENQQAGFISGSNVLLPWDVHVRLEHTAVWAAAFENRMAAHRRRKHQSQRVEAGGGDAQQPAAASPTAGQVITLKVFIGCEYECVLGHRFFMATPERALRNGSAGLAKDAGTRVVFNEMPLYAPCPCRRTEQQQQATEANATKSGKEQSAGWSTARVAQLQRVHIVTPKAPVHVIVEPRVRVASGEVFVMGVQPPARLRQSAYWVLRLPYAYESDEGGLVRAPQRLQSGEAWTRHGCLEAAMFGVSEMGADEMAAMEATT